LNNFSPGKSLLRLIHGWGLLAFLFFLLPCNLSAQYGWNFRYLTDKTTHWAHLASGDTVAIARLRFSKSVSTDPTEYHLINFGVRPLTNHINTWFVQNLQLWMDNGDSKFTTADSLLLTLNPGEIPPQSIPTYSISVATDITLADNQMLFIVAIMPNWQDDDVENLEIDTTSAGPDGIWFSVVDSLIDLPVTPEVNKNINTYTIKQFPIQAVNLPITVRNISPTTAEDDSSNLNMFFPGFLSRNGSVAAKQQRLDDQDFTAAVYLPTEFTGSGHKIESVEFDFGFDNTILELTSLEFGNIWGSSAFFYVTDTLYSVDQAIPAMPNYTVYHYAAELINASTDTTTYRIFNIDTASIALLNFKILKPGISPIFIMNEDLRDHFGIRYHTYRHLQNYANEDLSPTAERYDAWAKFMLGDWTHSTGGRKAGLDDFGDGRITMEDITLFSNYIWLNSDDSQWYERFDIGAATSHDPDEIRSDDTTNFYDLMVVAKNYNRTINGVFNQKIATGQQPHTVALTSEVNTNTRFTLQISDSGQLNAIHARLHFDPHRAALLNIKALTNSDGNPLLLYPTNLAEAGLLDINLFRLDGALGIDNNVLQIEMSGSPKLILDSLKIIGAQWDVETYKIGEEPDSEIVPSEIDLLNCYPNPFNSFTRINYALPASTAGQVQVSIYDLLGRRVRVLINQPLEAGRYSLNWNGTDDFGLPLSSGIYILQFVATGYQRTNKIILLR